MRFFYFLQLLTFVDGHYTNWKQQSLRIENPRKTILVFKTGYGYGGWGSLAAVIMNSSKCS